MKEQLPLTKDLSPWWHRSVVLVFVCGMAVLIFMSVQSYRYAPPIPESAVDSSGAVIFSRQDIESGQEVFLKYALMQNGSIWGHGSYLGPDFSAAYLHELALDTGNAIARKEFNADLAVLDADQRSRVDARVATLLKENRYDPATGQLKFLDAEKASYQRQRQFWADYFLQPTTNAGLPSKYINDPQEIRQLTAFFAWTAWASAANRPDKPYSYTNNFPHDPMVGNLLTADALLWSALSVAMLLAGLALVLFTFGRFDYLGWKGKSQDVHPHMLPGEVTAGQKATIKYFVIVALLFLAQVTIGGALAHYRAEPGDFYGIDLAQYLPSNILRTWHLQLALFWIATAYIAGGLLLASSVGQKEPRRHSAGVHMLFWALVVLVAGSLLGELLGIHQVFGQFWSWFGHQGWEFLELGRFWQVILVVGLSFWIWLLYRAIAPAMKDPERKEIALLFMMGAAAIPFFYLPAFFFGSTTNFTVVDTWRFWIIHLWVEGFFELFVTVLVAVTFYQLGVVRRINAIRVIYMDAILFLAGGIIGTAHHWYWTGQANFTMALAAMFSALEVVPLTILTLDAWDFIRLTGTKGAIGQPRKTIPHKWAFYFLMAVGFWNFVGAGIFGFLINMPVVSYFEAGTILTLNHGHAALLGAFGMLAMALVVLGLRHVLTDEQWAVPEKFIKVSFWGLNVGLALMVITNLFPVGVLQIWDVLENGYWHARSLEFIGQDRIRLLEWASMPSHVILIVLGVVPMVIASGLTYLKIRKA
ncbi:MAG: nitric-oxide reductase large subunit [Deltaproteobacteria bacterium]|nr:MAG: nitric-oxide reductase large subunit [Deltaproteobacteria bacterium]RPJ10566.1 MAG: nitric-oxide reductase large subunit [Deltaproteobacteria bacterium]RPJ12151.1 MAG: nitric-oxide reductase large subunit [Deltaproteobacteria bacterium]